MAPGRVHRLARDQRRRLGQRGEDAAGVKPANTDAEETFPINLSRFQLRDRGVTAIRTSERGAYAEAAFGEIEAVARAAADAVVGNPADPREVDSALQHEIFDEAAGGIVDQRGDNGRAQAEAAAKTTGHVVLAAALPHLKRAGGGHATFSWVEAQHHLAEADEVMPAARRIVDLHSEHQFGAELHDARRLDCRHRTEGRAVHVRVDRSKVLLVEDVEHLDAKLHFLFVCEPYVLEHGKVGVQVARSDDAVSRRRAELPRGGLGECGRIEPVTLRSAARGCPVRILAWDVIRAQRDLIAEDRSIRPRGNGQAPAGGVARHAGDLPAAEETARQSFPGPEKRHPVDVIHRENMLSIEVLVAVLSAWIARVLRKASRGGGVLTVRISTRARERVGVAEGEIAR